MENQCKASHHERTSGIPTSNNRQLAQFDEEKNDRKTLIHELVYALVMHFIHLNKRTRKDDIRI